MRGKKKHDEFFKNFISVKENAIDFINGTFPNETRRVLDLNSLELDNNSYIDDKLKKSFADIVYDCKVTDGGDPKVKIALLFEHKSQLESQPHFQILRYMLNIWEFQIKNKSLLQVVVPVVFYHGRKKWIVRSFGEYFRASDKWSQFLPNFEYILTDLSNYNKKAISEEMFKRDYNKVAILLMKYVSNSALLRKNLLYILKVGEKLFENGDSLENLKPIIIYLLGGNGITLEMITLGFENISEKGRHIVMTAADQLRKEGFREGIEKGIEKGIEEGRMEDAKMMKNDGLSTNKIIQYTGLSEKIINKL